MKKTYGLAVEFYDEHLLTIFENNERSVHAFFRLMISLLTKTVSHFRGR